MPTNSTTTEHKLREATATANRLKTRMAEIEAMARDMLEQFDQGHDRMNTISLSRMIELARRK